MWREVDGESDESQVWIRYYAGSLRSPPGYGESNTCHGFKKLELKTPKFEGKCDGPKGHICGCSDARQADIFTATNKEITEYVGCTYGHGEDIRQAVEKLEKPKIPCLAEPATITSLTEKTIWDKKLTAVIKRELKLDENLGNLYSLVLGQCTEMICARLEATKDFQTFSASLDALDLLKAIKWVIFNFQSQKFFPQALHELKRKLYLNI